MVKKNKKIQFILVKKCMCERVSVSPDFPQHSNIINESIKNQTTIKVFLKLINITNLIILIILIQSKCLL